MKVAMTLTVFLTSVIGSARALANAAATGQQVCLTSSTARRIVARIRLTVSRAGESRRSDGSACEKAEVCVGQDDG